MKIPSSALRLLAVSLVALVPSFGLSADFSAIWLNGSGNWSDATQWTTNPHFPNNESGVTYDATINDGAITLDSNITIQRLFLNGGTIDGVSALTINQSLDLTGGTLSGLTLNLATGSTSTIGANFYSFFGAVTINNSGTVDETAFVGGFLNRPTINNLSGAVWNIHNTDGASVQLNNSGTVVADGSLGFDSTFLTNSGSITVDGVLSVAMSSGGVGISSGTFNAAEVHFGDTGYTFTTGATVNATLVQLGETELHITGNTTINSDLKVLNSVVLVETGATLTLNGTLLDDTRGSVHLNGGTVTVSQALHFEDGRLSGNGTVNANVSHNATISPGGTQTLASPDTYTNSPGALVINGTLSILSGAKLVMEIGGLTQGTQYDHLTISGVLTLGGTLVLEMANGFEAQISGSETYTLVASGEISGVFANIANGQRLLTDDGTVSFQVNYGADSIFNPDDLVLSDPKVVPEPTSLLLLAVGTGGVGVIRYRRR